MNQTTLSHIKSKIFQDNTGKYAVAQPPNIPIYIIIVSYLMTIIFANGPANHLFEAVNSGAIFLWAYLEMLYGDSIIRRVFGVIVMIIFLISAL